LNAPPARELGFWSATALVVGNTIGMGLFVLPASLAPYGMNALLGWVVTAAGILVIAQVFARMARAYPEADSPYAYIRATLGNTPAFIALWCYWVSMPVANAALAIGIGGYAVAAVPGFAGMSPAVIAFGLIWLCVAVNLLGVRTGGQVQIATTLLKLLPIVAVVLLGAWVLFADPGAYMRDVPANAIEGSAVMAAATIALFALLGVESATIPAGRVRDPGRTIPRATMAGAVLTAGVCIAVSAVLILLIPQAQLAASQAPFTDLLERYSFAGSGRWVAAFVVISGLGALNGWTLVVGGLTHSMAVHGAFPARLKNLNSRGAPAPALVFTGLFASVMVLLNFSKTMVQGFTFLTLVVTAAALPLYLLCACGLAWLAWRGTSASRREYAVLGILGALYCVFWFVGIGAESFWWAIALAATGVPIHLWMRRSQGTAAR